MADDRRREGEGQVGVSLASCRISLVLGLTILSVGCRTVPLTSRPSISVPQGLNANDVEVAILYALAKQAIPPDLTPGERIATTLSRRSFGIGTTRKPMSAAGFPSHPSLASSTRGTRIRRTTFAQASSTTREPTAGVDNPSISRPTRYWSTPRGPDCQIGTARESSSASDASAQSAHGCRSWLSSLETNEHLRLEGPPVAFSWHTSRRRPEPRPHTP